MMQQFMGVTPQRYCILSMLVPERGPNQGRLPEEVLAQEWRDESLQALGQDIMQALLPLPPTCQFWITTLTYLNNFGNAPSLVDLPLVPMCYHDANALLPLPATPLAGF